MGCLIYMGRLAIMILTMYVLKSYIQWLIPYRLRVVGFLMITIGNFLSSSALLQWFILGTYFMAIGCALVLITLQPDLLAGTEKEIRKENMANGEYHKPISISL